MVDGVPYKFKKKRPESSAAETSAESFTGADDIFTDCASTRSDFEQLKSQFGKDCNLFVSANDLKLIGKQLSKTEKTLKELELKLQNTQLLMSR